MTAHSEMLDATLALLLTAQTENGYEQQTPQRYKSDRSWAVIGRTICRHHAGLLRRRGNQG